MAKTDECFVRIDTSKATKRLREPDWINDRDIVAFDTETTDGNVFLVSVSAPDTTFAFHDKGQILDPERVLDFLTQKQFRRSLNVWFNISFDAEVLLKFLPSRKLSKLKATTSIEYGNFEISYVRGKFLTLRDVENKETYEFFDVAQIFATTLDDAVESWLDESYAKNDVGINVERFNDADYVREHFALIRKYAENDALVTRLLSEKFFELAETNYNIPCGKPYSTGYLAESFLRQLLSVKPGWGIQPMQKMAWESYAGGRFEVFERGNVGAVVGPDINSAYPAVMATLPDPSTLAWRAESNPDIETIREADYGFVRAKLWTKPSKRIQPFAAKIDGTRVYPVFTGQSTTVLKDLFVFAHDNGYLSDFEIEKAMLGERTNVTRFPFSFMADKYSERKKLESLGNESGAFALKIILNSLYGKTLQTNWNAIEYGGCYDSSDTDSGLKVSFDETTGESYLEELVSGSLFNPFIATYITGLTRLQLHRTVERLDLIDATKMFATDCIMLDSAAYERSEFDSLLSDSSEPYREQLGKWDFDYEGDGFLIGSGVYQVDTDCGSKKGARGFRQLLDENIREFVRGEGTSVFVEHKRPISMGEALHQREHGTGDIGRFVRGKKELRASFDDGREWERENVSFDELLKNSENSMPVVL